MAVPRSIQIFPYFHGIRIQFTGKFRRIQMTWDKKCAEEGVASITTNGKFQHNMEKLRKRRKIGGLHMDKCND